MKGLVSMPKVIHTISATPLDRITIEPSHGGGAHVWLRRNILETVADTEGMSAPVWEADEVYLWRAEAPSISDVEADFAALWAVGAQDGDTETDRLADVEAALAELADLITGGDI